jgi:hypothetical protein
VMVNLCRNLIAVSNTSAAFLEIEILLFSDPLSFHSLSFHAVRRAHFSLDITYDLISATERCL